MHRRHRLGHRPFVRGVRAARQWRDGTDVRRRPRLARTRPLLGHLRTLWRHGPVHRADRDPRLHEMGSPSIPAGTTCHACASSAASANRSTPKRGCWYHDKIGRGRCPIVDTWWQTETGGDHHHAASRGHDDQAGIGNDPLSRHRGRARGRAGHAVVKGGGFLTITSPWPGMLRTIYGDDQRYRDTYWSRFPGRYFAGDGAKVDDDGYCWILGRVDDVLNVAGHRIGTMEVECALVDHPAVAEAAVVGKTDELKGTAIAAFVTLKGRHPPVQRAARRTARPRRPQDRRDRPPRRYPLLGRPAENTLGQDHAPPAARHRRGPGARRHHDARRSGSRGEVEGAV